MWATSCSKDDRQLSASLSPSPTACHKNFTPRVYPNSQRHNTAYSRGATKLSVCSHSSTLHKKGSRGWYPGDGFHSRHGQKAASRQEKMGLKQPPHCRKQQAETETCLCMRWLQGAFHTPLSPTAVCAAPRTPCEGVQSHIHTTAQPQPCSWAQHTAQLDRCPSAPSQ